MKRIAIFNSEEKPDVIKWVLFSLKILKNLGVECVARPELVQAMFSEEQDLVRPCQPDEFEKHADYVLSFGGDGTMLAAARAMLHTSVPIMGINVGKLGFLAEFSVLDLEESINDLMTGNYRIVDRAVLEGSLNGDSIYALNDFVVEKKDSSRMITIECYTNDHYIASIRADGLIITTPTGSTAYSLSCGGPIIAPSTEVICMTPISPHSLSLRPLVMPDSNEFIMHVFVSSGTASFVGDGRRSLTVNNGDTIVIRKSKAKIKLIKPLGSSYYDLLRNKLLWAANIVELDKK